MKRFSAKLVRHSQNRNSKNNKSGGLKSDYDDDDNDEEPLNDSPRSIMEGPHDSYNINSVEEMFQLHRKRIGFSSSSAELMAPIGRDGNIGRQPQQPPVMRGNSALLAENNNPFDIIDTKIYDDLTDPPTEGDYDFGSQSFFQSHNNSTGQSSERILLQQNVSSTSNNISNSNDLSDNSIPSSKKNKSKKSSPSTSKTRSSSEQRRSKSAQRPSRRKTSDLLEAADAVLNKSQKVRRAKSTGRAERQTTTSSLHALGNEVEVGEDDSESPKKRKSKLEKIIELQEKNQRYKDEFRKVQKDRKALKKEVETKKLEVAALTKEIDTQIAESSLLKLKLSEALQQLDRVEQEEEHRDRFATIKLQKELAALKDEYNTAISLVARMREEVESLNQSVARKDEQMQELTDEVSEQTHMIESLHIELDALQRNQARDSQTREQELQAENARLHEEYGITIQRTTDMVKEREEAIADLLKENEDLKRVLEEQNNHNQREDESNQTHQEEIDHLRQELDQAAKALEESQDRSVLLEEELEAWIVKGEEMETEIQRLRDDVEAWERKATATEATIAVVEQNVQQEAKRADKAEATLAEVEQKHREQVHENERRYRETILDLKEKAAAKIAEAEKTPGSVPPPNPQEMMLQKAVADRQRKQQAAARGSGWGQVISLVRNSNNENEEDISEEQRRIKDLETMNADQEREIEKLKSEIVRMRATYNDTMYMNKKRIEQLEMENDQFAAKQKALELELQQIQQEEQQQALTRKPTSRTDSDSSSRDDSCGYSI